MARRSRKHRTPAQKAATRKLVALMRARRGARTNPRRKRKHATHKRHRRNPAAPVAAMAGNPRRRHGPRRRYGVPTHYGHRRARRNPAGRGFMGALTSSVVPAIWGAGGAITVGALSGLATSKLPLPDMLRSGYGKVAVDVVLATALGTFGRRFLGHRATQMASGAMTVIAFNLLNPIVSRFIPGMSGLPGQIDGLGWNLPGQIGYYSPAETMGDSASDANLREYMPQVGEYMPERMGETYVY